MPSSHEATATVGARPAQERPITIGKTWRFLAAASIVLGLLALFAWALARDPKLISSPLIGKEAPLFALDLFDGGTFQLADQRGQVVVLNVWPSWCCPACWNEAPRLEAVWHQYRDQGVVLGPVLVVPYLRLAKREEQALEGRFGPRYRLHQQRVPGFLPVAGG